MVELDGGYLEGGGQILRTAVGLSAVTGIPCRIFNVRRGREKPGLRPQHLRGIEAVAALCGAELLGAALNSTEITFRPHKLHLDEKLSVQVGTAGAVTLVLQAVAIPLVRLAGPAQIVVTGGTHVPYAPVAEYFEHVFLRHVAAMGPQATLKLKRYGFYPKGGGRVELRFDPAPLHARDWTDRGPLVKSEAWSIASHDLRHARVAERQIEGARRRIEIHDEHVLYAPAESTGTAIFICSRHENGTLGASALGARGKPAEKVGLECADKLLEQLLTDACVDAHMADQILPYVALAPEDSTISVLAVTTHCRTNMWVIEQFLPVRFEVNEERGAITCRH